MSPTRKVNNSRPDLVGRCLLQAVDKVAIMQPSRRFDINLGYRRAAKSRICLLSPKSKIYAISLCALCLIGLLETYPLIRFLSITGQLGTY